MYQIAYSNHPEADTPSGVLCDSADTQKWQTHIQENMSFLPLCTNCAVHANQPTTFFSHGFLYQHTKIHLIILKGCTALHCVANHN